MFSVQRFQLEASPASYTIVDETGLPVPRIEEYLKYLRQTASPNTVRSYSRAIARWFNFLEPTNHTWKDFPTTFFGDFLTYLYTGRNPHQRYLGKATATWLSPASVQQHAAAVSAFYTYQADAHGLNEPYQKLHFRSSNRRAPYQRFLSGIAPNKKTTKLAYSIRSGNKHRQPILSITNVHAILEATAKTSRNHLVTQRDKLLFTLLWETGMRIGEALNLTHQDMNTGQGDTPFVEVIARQEHPHGVRGKTPMPRRIYISDELENLYVEYLWALIDQGIDLDYPNLGEHYIFVNVAKDPLWEPMRVESVYQRVRAILKTNPQLPKFTPHWFRHTHATTLLLAGVQPHVVMRRLGHADVQTTLDTYGWVTDDAEMKAWEGWKNVTEAWRGI